MVLRRNQIRCWLELQSVQIREQSTFLQAMMLKHRYATAVKSSVLVRGPNGRCCFWQRFRLSLLTIATTVTTHRYRPQRQLRRHHRKFLNQFLYCYSVRDSRQSAPNYEDAICTHG